MFAMATRNRRCGGLLAGLLLATVVSAQPFTEADWPTRGRSADRHYAAPFDLQLTGEGRLNLKWKRFFGERVEVEMEPVVVGDTVYLGVMNGKLYALDRETGAVRWVFTAGGAISDTPTACFASDGGLRLVFGAHDGLVYCLDAAGELRWSFGLDGPVMMTPVVHGGTVLVGTIAGTFYGLAVDDAVSQRQAWRFAAGAPLANSPALGEAAAGLPAVFFANGANTAFALDPVTGAELWRTTLAGAFSKHILAVAGVGSGGKRVVCFLTRKPGFEYSEPRENLPAILQGSIQPGPVVLEAWADYYHQYPRRRPAWWLDAASGADLWDYDSDKTRYQPLYLPYWGLHTPVVDAAGRAWLPASGSGGDHALEHDIRLWRMDLETGVYEHIAYETEFQARADEIGRPTLLGARLYTTISEDIASFDTVTRAENTAVFGNGIFNHRYPIEIDDFEHGRVLTPPFGGRYKHFSRFGGSSPAGYAGGVDATSPLVAVRDGARTLAFYVSWGHLYALTAEPVATPVAHAEETFDPWPGPRAIPPAAAVRQQLAAAVEAFLAQPALPLPRVRWWDELRPPVEWQGGETLIALVEALPYLDEPQLRGQLETWLVAQFQTRALTPAWISGQAAFDYDTGTFENPAGTGGGVRAKWYWDNPNFIADRLWALHRFVELTGASGAGRALVQNATNWSRLKAQYSFFKTAGAGGAFFPALGFFGWPTWRSEVTVLGADNFHPNRQLAATLAMRELAALNGDTALQTEADSYHQQMLAQRVNRIFHARGLYDAGTLVPVSYDTCNAYGLQQGNLPIPAEGRRDRETDFRQLHQLSESGTVAFVRGRTTARPYRLTGFHPFLEPFNALGRDDPAAAQKLAQHVAAIEALHPFWYTGDYGHAAINGNCEEDSATAMMAADVFQAKAYVLGASYADLAGRIPWPYENHGLLDVYRLRCLEALLWVAEREEAAGYAGWAATQGLAGPAAAPAADPEGDGVVNLLEYAMRTEPLVATGDGPAVALFEANGATSAVLSHRRNRVATDLVWTYETSADLVAWNVLVAPTIEVVDPDPEGDGTAELLRVLVPLGGAEPRLFLRVRATLPVE